MRSLLRIRPCYCSVAASVSVSRSDPYRVSWSPSSAFPNKTRRVFVGRKSWLCDQLALSSAPNETSSAQPQKLFRKYHLQPSYHVMPRVTTGYEMMNLIEAQTIRVGSGQQAQMVKCWVLKTKRGESIPIRCGGGKQEALPSVPTNVYAMDLLFSQFALEQKPRRFRFDESTRTQR